MVLALATGAFATPVSFRTAASGVDWTSAGVAGTGGGSGSITVSGVTGTVTTAYLYWHGIDNSGSGAVYDNATVAIDGNPVTGVALGDATTNCWGAGSSRAFRADVTAFVTGDGTYAITGLSALTGHNANGASLVVVFDDGNGTNNRDLVFFEGNDSNIIQGFPGEDDGWNATLSGIDYQGGAVNAQFHMSDGQDYFDGSVTFTSGVPSMTIPDTSSLWDGNSLPTAGTSRAGNGGLWDIHTFDITAAFGAPGPHTLTLSGQEEATAGDCLGLVLVLIDLAPGSVAACGDGNVNQANEVCDDGNTVSGDGCDANCTPTGCGNGIVTGTEQCDDGNTVSGDGCSETCQSEAATCGDGNEELPETCDDGNLISGDGCDANCTPTGCGNTIITSGEQCDDGNTISGDGCSSTCQSEVPECGDSQVEGAEECDDGNTDDGDCCSASCQYEDVGSACDLDADLCTIDQCDGSGTCGFQSNVVCTALDQCHVPGTCSPATGICDNPNKPDGFACNDGDECTNTDSCTNGMCAGSSVGADTDADGYCDAWENKVSCNPNDFFETPPQGITSPGSAGPAPGQGLLTLTAPGNRKVRVPTESSCATAGVCGPTGFCTAGQVGDPCETGADCNQAANTCRIVVNYAEVPDFLLVSATLNKAPLAGFTPATPGCARKVDVALDPARFWNRVKIYASGTVHGKPRRDRDRFLYCAQ